MKKKLFENDIELKWVNASTNCLKITKIIQNISSGCWEVNVVRNLMNCLGFQQILRN